MSAEKILQGLQKVRSTGKGKWVACCPAHEDRSPSLAIREMDDGRILLHCFSGCTVPQVLDSLGLSIDELFPEKFPRDKYKPGRLTPLDALICIEGEARIVYTLAANLAYKGDLSKEDKERGQIAALRIISALKHALR